MTNQGTIAELFALAIAAERAAEQLYLGLAARFAHRPPVAEFWKRYAAEEAGHARWLQDQSQKLTAEQLAAPAEPALLADARQFRTFSVTSALQGIDDLEAAYQLVHELEHSEINVIFEFLISNYAADQDTQQFLRTHLRQHVASLIDDFPKGFGETRTRRAVKAMDQPTTN